MQLLQLCDRIERKVTADVFNMLAAYWPFVVLINEMKMK